MPLDIPTFMAARARYFAAIFWHDETWCNQNEECRFVWTDGTTGIGQMRHSQNKGIYYFFYISTDCSL